MIFPLFFFCFSHAIGCGAHPITPDSDGVWRIVVPRQANMTFTSHSKYRYAPRLLDGFNSSLVTLMVKCFFFSCFPTKS